MMKFGMRIAQYLYGFLNLSTCVCLVVGGFLVWYTCTPAAVMHGIARQSW
jgi:hypothetical protein